MPPLMGCFPLGPQHFLSFFPEPHGHGSFREGAIAAPPSARVACISDYKNPGRVEVRAVQAGSLRVANCREFFFLARRSTRACEARAGGGAIDWIARRGVKRGGAVNALLFLIRTADLADE